MTIDKDIAIGGSEAIPRNSVKFPDEEEFKLEDIVNEHHTEIHNHGGSSQ